MQASCIGTRLFQRTVHRLLISRFFSAKASSLLSGLPAKLAQSQPMFQVPANDLRILAEPKEFYASLLDMIQQAQERIFLSSLYIGSGETELVDALGLALQKNPRLQVHLQLDLNRSTRPGASSTARLLLPLLRAYPNRVKVHLFRSPSLRGLLAKIVPPRFNEGWGTWHAKIYGADSDLIISGANLNSNYFTNRRDRYISFTKQQSLANYCYGYLSAVSAFSYRLLPSDDPSFPLGPHSYRQEDYNVIWDRPDEHPHTINESFQAALSSFQTAARISGPQGFDENRVGIFPIIQGGQFNIREEESILNLLFDHLRGVQARPLLDLTSGYFNLYKPYQNLILRASNVTTRIVAASPKANGFYGSKGVSGRIPEGYTILERRFMELVKHSNSNVELDQWEREGWTYHAKGLWLSPDAESDPVLTLFGSTNLNARSAHIDTELSFMMVVPPSNEPEVASANHVLRRRLAEEVASIRKHVTPWTGHDRHVRFATPMMLRIVEDML
ncbi:hypothetical protein CPB85DRAFT_1211042 [Mucidula mucida]|nr:hypothetical protein CPB85DRAFT_1211042 [Mucidula mucida]